MTTVNVEVRWFQDAQGVQDAQPADTKHGVAPEM